MRKFMYFLFHRSLLVFGLTMTTIAATRVLAVGVVPQGDSAMFPAWFPASLATYDVAWVISVAMTPAVVIFWVAYTVIGRKIRKMFPREA